MSFGTIILRDSSEPKETTVLTWSTDQVVYFSPYYNVCIDATFRIIPYSISLGRQNTDDPDEILEIYKNKYPA